MNDTFPEKIHWSIASPAGCIECCLIYSNIDSALKYKNLWSTPEECLAFQKKPQSLAVRICARFAQLQIEPQIIEKHEIDSINNAPYFVDNLNALSLSHDKQLVAAFVVKSFNPQQKILSNGVDCASIQRFIKPTFQKKLIDRIATDHEQKWLQKYPENLVWFWAAKEAVSKVLKTGIGLVSWKEIEIRSEFDSLRNLNVKLYGQAKKVGETLNINSIILQRFSYQHFAIVTAVGLKN